MKSAPPARQVGYLVHDCLAGARDARELAQQLARHGIATALERTAAGAPSHLVFLDQRRGVVLKSQDMGLTLLHFQARFQANQQAAQAAVQPQRPAQQPQFQRQRGG
jgi:hypothetical protein